MAGEGGGGARAVGSSAAGVREAGVAGPAQVASSEGAQIPPPSWLGLGRPERWPEEDCEPEANSRRGSEERRQGRAVEGFRKRGR